MLLMSMSMSEFDHKKEIGKKNRLQDYYTWHYWDNNTYESTRFAESTIRCESEKYGSIKASETRVC